MAAAAARSSSPAHQLRHRPPAASFSDGRRRRPCAVTGGSHLSPLLLHRRFSGLLPAVLSPPPASRTSAPPEDLDVCGRSSPSSSTDEAPAVHHRRAHQRPCRSSGNCQQRHFSVVIFSSHQQSTALPTPTCSKLPLPPVTFSNTAPATPSACNQRHRRSAALPSLRLGPSQRRPLVPATPPMPAMPTRGFFSFSSAQVFFLFFNSGGLQFLFLRSSSSAMAAASVTFLQRHPAACSGVFSTSRSRVSPTPRCRAQPFSSSAAAISSILIVFCSSIYFAAALSSSLAITRIGTAAAMTFYPSLQMVVCDGVIFFNNDGTTQHLLRSSSPAVQT